MPRREIGGCKMATRWGAREESFVAGGVGCFSAYAPAEDGFIREDVGDLSLSDPLDVGQVLGSLPTCLDSSILSIFEDPCVPVQTDGQIDEDGEAALLTALTEALDNVDSENLSPFDMLPDSELFSGQKDRDPSPLRRLLNLSRSPPEKEHAGLLKPTSCMGHEEDVCTERSQRSHGEEGDWDIENLAGGFSGDLELPLLDMVELGHLGDLVKQVYPYCVAVSLELGDGDGPPIPEGGIVLEVVDRGEQGETILAVSGPLDQPGGAKAEPVPEGICPETRGHDFAPAAKDGDDEASEDRPKKPTSEKCPSRRKKKRKSKKGPAVVDKQSGGSVPAEQAADTSGPSREELLGKKSQEITIKKKRVSFAPVLTSVLNTGDWETTMPPKHEEAPPGPSLGPVHQPVELEPPAAGGVDQDALPPQHPLQDETRPKPLSLQQYRLLRQQKKPTPVDKLGDSSTKWPILAEPPKELPPIPCLPEPKPIPEQRRTAHLISKALPEEMPAWHPIGSSIPPTPEALLVPPGSVVGPSKPPTVPKSVPTSKPVDLMQAQSQPLGPAVSAPSQQPSPDATNHAPPAVAARPPQPGACHWAPSPPTKLHPVGTSVPTAQTTTDARQLHRPNTPVSKVVLPTLQGNPSAAPAPATAQAACVRSQLGPQKKLLVQPANESMAERRVQPFTSEIGIEATDLTSLLEQFEETQAKEEHTVPEVSSRVAAVGNSWKPVERGVIADLASTAGLTPPATPPHQTWKPLTPVALLGKPKPSPTKAIQIIDPRPLPPSKARCKPLPQVPAGSTQHPAFADHDYCRLSEGSPAVEQGAGIGVCVKQHQPGPAIQPGGGTTSMLASQQAAPSGASAQPLDHRTQPEVRAAPLVGSVLLSPDASPSRVELNPAPLEEEQAKSRSSAYCSSGCLGRPVVRERGRTRRRYRARSPSSSSSSSSESSCSSSESQSRSPSPPRKRFCSRSRRSHSSSSSSSCSPSRSACRHRRGSYSSSRSRSCSRSRSRSPCWRGTSHSPNYRCNYRYNSRERLQGQDAKDRKQKAIEERRVVYVGRIRGGMTRKELKERFSLYGEIEDCTLHFREHGDNYGFVTYYNTKDAFNAIENGGKLRQCNELPFDLCFGGRRQFCKSSYADLDSSREYDPAPTKSKFDALDFDTLLRQAQKGLKR